MVTTEPDTAHEAFVARLTTAAYQVALRHGIKGSFAALQLDLWYELRAACADLEPVPGGEDRWS